MTTPAVPTQWEGRTSDGFYVYIRYRWGELTVNVGWNEDDVFDALIFEKRIGGEYDGVLSSKELLNHLPASISVDQDVAESLLEAQANGYS